MYKNILLLGASLESDNKGVNALGIGAITLLKSNFPNATISLLCIGEVEGKIFALNVNDAKINVAVNYFSKKEVLKGLFQAYLHIFFAIKPTCKVTSFISKHDIVFDINEGDSFSDLYGLKRILRHFSDSKLILLLGKPLVFLPQTIGPFDSKVGKFLGGHILKRLNKLYVRDTKAYDFIDSLKVKKELSIDMAVYVNRVSVGMPVQNNTIGINVNGLMYLNNYENLKGQYESYPKLISDLIDRLITEGFKVILVPHVYNQKNPKSEDDLVAIKSIMKKKDALKESILYVDKDHDAQELKAIISGTDFFIGSRMHSCIAGLSTSVPTIGLAYSYKFEGTFSMFNQQGHVINISDLKAEGIQNVIENIMQKVDLRSKTKDLLIASNQRKLLKIELS
jgi:colanic acid/amylovoran biosynthesis protein